MNAIVNTLEELGFVRNEEQKAELAAMTTAQLMKDFVLPHCLCLPRSGVRYPRISGSFMKLMTAHGRDFLNADYELGSVLLELAMQRITRHPSLPAIDYREMLPDVYKPYAASSVNPNGYNGCPDEPGLWGSEEVHFLLEMLPVCFTLRNKAFADHAKLILFQMVSMLANNGRFMWLNGCYCDVREEDAWKAAVDMLFSAKLEQEFVDYCLENNWRIGRRIFQMPAFQDVHRMYLADRIDIDKETYYRGFKRGLLKLCGLYPVLTRVKLWKEIGRPK